MAHADIGGERGARKIFLAGLSRHAIRANGNEVRSDGVATGWGACARHGVSREEDATGGFGADKILEHSFGQMNPVGNEAGGEFVAGEEALDDVVMTRQFERTAVAEVRAKTGASANSRVDLGLARIRVAKRDVHALLCDGSDIQLVDVDVMISLFKVTLAA